MNGFFGDHSYTDGLPRGSPVSSRALAPMSMVHLITPHYQRKRFFRPRRPGKIWRAVRRYQVLELLAFTGAIAAVWLGAHLDNARQPWATPEPVDVESASANLISAEPAGKRRPL